MRHLPSRGFKALVALALLAGSVIGTQAVAADGSTNGLGQSWPNAQDVSSSARWHVYVFTRNGVRYVQVNDLHGNVRGAIATAGGSFMVLPIGVDANRVATPDDPQPAPASTDGDIVYKDDAVQVLAAPQADGTVMMRAALSTCKDPVECSSRVD